MDILEEVIEGMAPPQKDYQMFYLKHSTALYVTENLVDYFKEGEKEKKQSRPYWYYWDYGNDDKTEEPPRLSKRKPIKFISDWDTNSIMVRGGDAAQWKVVEELIAIYDRPLPDTARNIRYTKMVKLNYADAKQVEEAVKSVYRDLLSANDKALQNQDKNQKNSRYTINYGNNDDDDSVKQSRFKGALSIGIYKDTNSMIVSAKKNILENVINMIETLDEQAKPLETNLHVFKLQPGMDSETIQQRLSKLLKKPTPPKKDQKKQPKQQQNQNGPIDAY